MGVFIDILKVVILSIVEGITEFLPVSSTGHLILVNKFINLEPANFANAFNIIIQLGAILSVVVIYFNRLNPWHSDRENFHRKPGRYDNWNWQTKLYYNIRHVDKDTINLWKRVLIGVIPGGVIGFLFDDFLDAHLMNMQVVTFTLIFYGILMILIENGNKHKKAKYNSPLEFSYKTAFLIGLFQCLALIPGTSRSAATIIGAMILGANRTAAAEFSFFMAIPTMVGASGLKIIKNLSGFSIGQWILILLGFVLSFIVAYLVIKKFMTYIQKRDFRIFGLYRIILGLILLVYILFTM